MPALRDRLQTYLGDTYTLVRELGGGMSRVFLADEQRFGRQVVIKVLPLDLSGAVSVERFEREITLAARLQHPHIVPLLTAGDAGRELLTETEERAASGAASAVEPACIHHALGNDDGAFVWLERAFNARDLWMSWLHLDPRLRALHGDRRFDALVRRVGTAPSNQSGFTRDS